MLDINKQQYKMLCRIQKHKVVTTDNFSSEELEICQYLMENNCIKARHFSRTDIHGDLHITKTLPTNLMLTQTGKAQIYAFRSTFYKWWIPVVISVISVALSSASIISQVIQLLIK